jgi:omega-6 fatty acid desaturase (delta-12 desaturase)
MDHPGTQTPPPWVAATSRFEAPSGGRAAWQLANTLLPYLGLLALMTWTVRTGRPYAVTLGLAVPAAGFMVRLFILFHDCVHGSFIRSARLRRALGRTLGVLVFTPFTHWGRSHLGHHVTSGTSIGAESETSPFSPPTSTWRCRASSAFSTA